MTNVRTSSLLLTRFAMFATGSALAFAAFLGTAQYAHAAPLTSTNVQPANLTVAASSTVTASFTTATDLPSTGIIKVTFPSGFNIATLSAPVNCSGMTGGFSFSGSGQTITLTRNGAGGTVTAPAAISCTFPTITNPGISGSTGSYDITTYQSDGTTVIDTDASVTADTIVASDPNASVAKSTAVAGSDYGLTLTTDIVRALVVGDKINITFPSSYVVSATNPTITSGQISCSSGGATMNVTASGQILTLTVATSGTLATSTGCTISINGTNAIPQYVDTTDISVYTIQNSSSANISSDTTVALTNTEPADAAISLALAGNSVVGTVGNSTLTLTIPVSMGAGDVVDFYVGNNLNASGAARVSESFAGAGDFSCVGVSATQITCTANGTITAAVGGTIVMSGIVSLYAATGQMVSMLTATDTGNGVIASDAGGTQTDTTAAVLTSTNVTLGATTVGTTNTATIVFTTANSIAANGKVKVTFGSGFVLTGLGSSSMQCSTLTGGSVATTVSGQVVTLTRTGGDIEVAGAQTCTIASVTNPSSAGSTGTYTISTTDSSNNIVDTDAAVAADSITSTGGSSSSAPAVALTYGITLSAPVVAAEYESGDSITISWSTDSGTGSVSAVNLSYSADGGITYTSIVSGTLNDGTYSWIAPDIDASSVIIRAQGTDLITVLATDTSDAFSIGDTDADEDTSDDAADDAVEDTDTSAGSTTLLPTGTFMKGESWTTVYYVEGSTRRPFLDAQTFFTYADNFDSVIDTSDDYLANYSIGAPMLPAAGSVLIKIVSVNNVYALGEDGELRWISSESAASDIYGSNWADYVIDVPVTAWSHFTFGSDIDSAGDISLGDAEMQTRDALNSK